MNELGHVGVDSVERVRVLLVGLAGGEFVECFFGDRECGAFAVVAAQDFRKECAGFGLVVDCGVGGNAGLRAVVFVLAAILTAM